MIRDFFFFGGLNSFRPFIFTINSGVDSTFTIRTNIVYVYNYNVKTSDGQVFTGITGNHTITFPSANTNYTVSITGTFPAIYTNNMGTLTKLLGVNQWGDVLFSSMDRAFYGCANFSFIPPTEVPNVSTGGSAYLTFSGTILNQDLRHLPFSKFNSIQNFISGNSFFDKNMSDIDLSGLVGALAIANAITNCSSFTNGGVRLRWDLLSKTLNFGTYPLVNTKVKEMEFVNANNLTWNTGLTSSGGGLTACEVFILGSYATSLDLSATSYNKLPSLTGTGMKEMLDKFDKTFAGTVKVYSAVYTRLDNYVISLGYTGVANYLTSTGNSWTVTF